jgi:hypothetical protein
MAIAVRMFELAASSPEAGQLIAASLFAETSALLGGSSATAGRRTRSAEAWGRSSRGSCISRTMRWFGRGERDSPATTDLPITMRLAEPPEPFDWLRSA